MSIVLPATDPRAAKAVSLASDAGQWIRCRDRRSGAKSYAIRSSHGDVHYLVTRSSCTCKAFEYGRGRDCYHVLSVQLHCERVEDSNRASCLRPEDIFARFEQDDRPLPTPDLTRILGKPRRGTRPARLIMRED